MAEPFASSPAVTRRASLTGRWARSVVVPVVLTAVLSHPTEAQDAAERTRVVILGVGHSTQLVAERQQPAALRAFFDRVEPDVIAVERAPEEFARGDRYEFTYEIQ